MLALFALACSTVEEDAGSTSTRSEDTGPETTEPWCCWCDEQGAIRCVDETGPGECKAFGAKIGADVVETGCTGLPSLGTLDCPGLVCELPSESTDSSSTDSSSTDSTDSTDSSSTDGGGGLAACCELEGGCDGGPGLVELICDPVVGGACLTGELVDGCDYVGAAIVCPFMCG